VKWDNFAKYTIGIQGARALDSNSVNIAERFGRYGKKDEIKFYRYSFAPVKESLDWLQKVKIRKLVLEKQYRYIFKKLNQLPREINTLILNLPRRS